MTTFQFWARIGLAVILGLIGFILGSILPLPSPFYSDSAKAFYAILGVLIGLSTFAKISSWIVKTATRLIKQAAYRFASEMINQFTQLTSRGWSPQPLDPTNSLGGSVILDTSSIIDGRILDIARTGFLSGIFLVPNFVLTELQQVADSADSIKRARGRKGFETVDDLKKIEGVKVTVWDKEIAGKAVDDKLIRLGKILHAKILTCDFNMNRVAKLSGVTILNMNELANALKTVAIPGEKLTIKINHLGKDHDQGVGYLQDGTMVVVKDGAELIDQEVEIEVTKILQSPAGRMIFGKIPSSL